MAAILKEMLAHYRSMLAPRLTLGTCSGCRQLSEAGIKRIRAAVPCFLSDTAMWRSKKKKTTSGYVRKHKSEMLIQTRTLCSVFNVPAMDIIVELKCHKQKTQSNLHASAAWANQINWEAHFFLLSRDGISCLVHALRGWNPGDNGLWATRTKKRDSI